MTPKKKLHVVVADVEPARTIKTERVVVPTADLRISKQHQYRHHFDDARMSELAESVRRVGVQQPPWVRRIDDGVYEIIAGERRLRAARIAGLEEIPCDVKTWDDGTPVDDEMSFELAVIENNQRENPHPLEESDAFVTLRSRFGHTAEHIASRIRRSLSYVYERLALADLEEEARTAFWNGQIGIGVALVLSRITHAATQAEAVKMLVCSLLPGDSVKLTVARDVISRNFLLQLHNAPFDAGDSKLVKDAGSCTSCPKRSGNQGLLFETAGFDKKTADSCTDRGCWERKKQASTRERLEEAKKKGVGILEGSIAKELFPYGDQVNSRIWIDLDAGDYQYTQGKAWRVVLGKDRVKRITISLVKSPNGSLLEVAKRAEVLAIMREHPKDTDLDAVKSSRDEDVDEEKRANTKEENKKLQVENIIRSRTLDLARERARSELISRGANGAKRHSIALTRAIIKSFVAEDCFDKMIARRQWNDVVDPEAKAFEAIDEAPLGELLGMLTELASHCLSFDLTTSTWDPIEGMCEAEHIDFKAMLTEAEIEVRKAMDGQAEADAKKAKRNGGDQLREHLADHDRSVREELGLDEEEEGE